MNREPYRKVSKSRASHDLGAATVPPNAMREMAVRFQEQKVVPWRWALGQRLAKESVTEEIARSRGKERVGPEVQPFLSKVVAVAMCAVQRWGH